MYHRSGNFHVTNNSHEKFRAVKFSQFCSIRKNFLTVDDYNMDERLKSFLPFSQLPGIAGCSCRSNIYPGECGHVLTSLFIDRRRVSLIFTC